MEKKDYKTFIEGVIKEIEDEFRGKNKLSDDECLLLVASTDEASHCAVVGSEKELVATLAKIIVEDESLKDAMEKALHIAEVVTTLQKVAKGGDGEKLASMLGKEDKQ